MLGAPNIRIFLLAISKLRGATMFNVETTSNRSIADSFDLQLFKTRKAQNTSKKQLTSLGLYHTNSTSEYLSKLNKIRIALPCGRATMQEQLQQLQVYEAPAPR